MKKICISTLWIVMTISSFSQENTFLRVYNPFGNKIAQGHLSGTTDSSLLLTKGEKTLEINYSLISFIKTKHSTWHNILVTGAIFGGAGMILAIATHKSSSTTGPSTLGNFQINFSTESEAIAGLVVGGITGAAIGGIAGSLKKINTYKVNAHFEDWQKVRLKLDTYLANKKEKTGN